MTVIGHAPWAWPRGATWSSISIATSRDKTSFAWWNVWQTSRNQHKMNRLYRTFGKRALDLAVAVPALLLASPIIALVALAVRWRLGSPAVFRQQRPGYQGQPFYAV